MAPPDSLVHSAEYEMGLPMTPVLLPCTSPVSQVFNLRLKCPSGRSPYKGEWAPGIDFSFTKLHNKIKHSRNTKRRQELQYDDSNTLCRIVWRSIPAPSDNLQQINIKGFAPVNLTVKIEPDLGDTLRPLLKSLCGSNHFPTTQVPKHEQDTEFAIKIKPNHDLESAPEPRVFDRKDSISPVVMISSVCDTGKTQNNHIPSEVHNLQHRSGLPGERQIVTKASHMIGNCFRIACLQGFPSEIDARCWVPLKR
ncbi:hypothetical protein RSOL_348350 [Rhizoctonia solani AG-3 Rhs1AP]|uniref:Uncharacterized protein n=2 Tax=Rhizoctonia solani AG-3 TaxID=1086053 RepID=A0A074RH68_9AGAM|nr:hypothetical protein RSOL_348350 [Rhizoctonia solani AG-3 Rhs1AP]KEP46124.1 hypothetical protein V565_217560 [Rhizoctonia solani 123E]